MTTRSNRDPLFEEDEHSSAGSEDAEDTTPEKTDPRTLFGSLKDGLAGQDEISVLKSSFQQATLVGMLSVLLVTLVAASIFSNMTIDAMVALTAKRGSGNNNVLGLYYLKTPSSRPSLSDSDSIPRIPRVGETGESYFLRYYVVPTEVVAVGSVEPEMGSTLTDPTTSNNHSDIRAEGVRVELMSPGRRWFIIPRALVKELVETTKEDILSPMKERWAGRMGKLKDSLLPTEQSKGDDDGASLIVSSGSGTTGGASPNTIFGMYPEDDENTTKKPSEAKRQSLQAIRDNTPQLPRIPVPAGKSACPTSLFCFYKLPATVEKDGVACANYCGRCFESNAELKSAIRDYLEDPSSTSEVAKTYGWPIDNWCVSLISDFSYAFADTDFNEDISRWDTSSAVTLSHMFHNAKYFNRPLDKWDTSHVTDLSYFLAGAKSFNRDLNSWTTNRVRDMSFMFQNAVKFNGKIEQWQVSQVTNLESAFQGASSFARNIVSWKPKTSNRKNMFEGATKFERLYKDTISLAWSRGANLKSLMFGGEATSRSEVDTTQSLLHRWGIARNSTNATEA